MGRAEQQAYFTQIYRDTLARLSRHVYFKIGDLAEAEDIVATVYTDFYQLVVLRGRRPENSMAYLKKMADHEISRFLAKRTAVLSFDDDEIDLRETVPADLDVESAIFESFAMDEIWAAIRQLSGPEQTVLVARHRLEMSFVEIARDLGQVESTVKLRYYRAIRKLQKKFSQTEKQM